MARRRLPPKSPLASLSILIADHSPHMAGLLFSAVKGIGAGAAVRVGDAAAVRAALKSRKFDVAVLDFDLRPRGAIELTLELRRSRLPYAHLPVIGLAKSVEPEALRAAMLAGINKVVVKPVSGDTLRARLLEILGEAVIPPASAVRPGAADTVEI